MPGPTTRPMPKTGVKRRRPKKSSQSATESWKPTPTLESTNDGRVKISPDDPTTEFTESECINAQYLERFFTRKLLNRYVVPIVDGKSPVSLRDLTWAATNFFPQQRVKVRDPNTGFIIRLDQAYNMYLAEFRKYGFDSFQRVYKNYSQHIVVTDSSDPTFRFRTTFAQLKFFQFAIEYQFIENVEKYIDQIKTHWHETNERRKREKHEAKMSGAKKAKRTPLTQRRPESMEIVDGTFEISY